MGSAYPWGPRADPCYVGGMGAGATTTSEQRRLVLDVVDARTGKLTWCGTAEGPVDTGSLKFEQKVRQAVGKLMERFPPSPRGAAAGQKLDGHPGPRNMAVP